MAEKLTLASMCAGGVQERIDRALAKISDNILDLNTDAKKKRVLDVKITLTPNEDDIDECMSNGWKGIIWDKLQSSSAYRNSGDRIGNRVKDVDGW